MKIDDETITFDRGRSFSACFGIIGLGDDGKIAVGYDDLIVDYPPNEADVGGPTTPELIELVDIMIARWTALRERLKGEVG